jgi:hypothetical protein
VSDRPQDPPERPEPGASGRPRERFHGRVAGAARGCEWPGCDQAGEFRAPKSLRSAGDPSPSAYRWYCLEHVREFNAAYNFFDQLTPEEKEALERGHPSWDRATRPFASNGTVWTTDPPDMLDPLDLLKTQPRRRAAAKTAANGHILSAAELKALTTLGLDEKASAREIRSSYKRLLKRYHPDQNGGDRSLESLLQGVLEAYGVLSKSPAFAAG